MDNRNLILLALALKLTSGLYSQRNLKDIPDPDPEIERASFQVHEDFEVNLFAADPAIAKPIQMNWDRYGRLWIASSSTYPQIEPGQVARDKIIILEDTDQDGKSDKTTVFKDGLLIPTGVVPADGGAYVANSTEILFLEDTDKDGKADKETVMLSGFGTEDTHHIIHTFRGGHDGCIYFNQSIYIHSHIETPWGVRRLGGGGIWQFRPESRRLEIFCRGFVNPWGHITDDWGQSFATDGAYAEGINYVFPGSVFKAAPDAPRIVKGLNPGQPKQCGLTQLSGSHIPDAWQGALITNDFRGHRVNSFFLTPENSGYNSRQGPNLISTNHGAFRPIAVEMGPDGAIYIADWYNPIIQHGEVDFRDHRRDHIHGRIWRVTAKGRKALPYPKVAGASVGNLLEMLKSKEGWTRHFAKRELRDRDPSNVRAVVDKWVSGLDKKDPAYDHHCLEAMWVMHSLDKLHKPLFQQLLSSKDPRARAAAIRMIYERHAEMDDPMPALTKAIWDVNAQVRLEAIHALRQLRRPESAKVALQALDKEMDDNLDFALWHTARELEGIWFPSYKSGELSLPTRHLTFALKATGNPDGVTPVVSLLEAGKLKGEQQSEALSLIAEAGSPKHLDFLLGQATGSGNPTHYLNLLKQAAQNRNIRPASDPGRVLALLGGNEPAAQSLALELAGYWKLEDARPKLTEVAKAKSAPQGLRMAALNSLATIGGSESLQVLRELGDASQPLNTRSMAAAAMVNLAASAASTLSADLLCEIEIAQDAAPIYDAFFQKSNGPRYLAKALEGKTLSPEIAILGIRKAAGSGKRGEDLVNALTKAANLQPMEQRLTPEQMDAFVEKVRKQGNPVRGEQVYRQEKLACMNCHAIGGAGPVIGPDLVSLGSSAPVDYIIDSLLDPNKKIKEGYHLTTVNTPDGQVHTGALVSRNEQSIQLRDATGKVSTVPLGNSTKVNILNASLMPPGLTATLRQDEFIDLVRFLSELGKEGPYKVSHAQVVRTWDVLQKSGNWRAFNANSLPVVRSLEGMEWKPVYSQVSGELPVAQLPVNRRFDLQFHMLSFHIEVTTPGQLTFLPNDSTGLQVWVADQNPDFGKSASVELPKGKHEVLVAIDTTLRKTPLRLGVEGSGNKKAIVKILN